MPLIENESADFAGTDSINNDKTTICQNNIIVISSDAINHTNNDNNKSENLKQNHLTPMQTKFIIISLSICNFFIANGVSLQGPFFPKEAEQKGCEPLIYSIIFAIYELIMLTTSFMFGNFAEKFKANRMSGLGMLMTGLSTTAFGFITFLNDKLRFVMIAFILRIIESLGATAFATSSYSFISVCFPDRTATMFATMEMFFGLGVITGPVIGGLLYDLHGFLLPFLVNGLIIGLFGIILITRTVEKLFLRGKLYGQLIDSQNSENLIDNSINNDEHESNTLIVPINESSESSTTDIQASSTGTAVNSEEQTLQVTLGRFLSSTVIVIDSFIIVTAITLMGFIGATLEPFIRHEISDQTLHTSLMFVALGASYSFFSLFWGKICDKFPSLIICFSIAGSIVTGIGLLLLAPVPFLAHQIKPELWIISVCMILFGIGTSSKQVSAYTHALNYTINHRKFPKNQKTYGLISGMFFSCLSLGGFIGPIIGGSLLQWSDFHYATMIMFIVECIVLFILLILQCFL